MTRTAARSLPACVVPPLNALVYSLALSAVRIALEFLCWGLLPSLFVALGWFSYAVVL
jgi:heme O synthase-like polyprenyltransferase